MYVKDSAETEKSLKNHGCLCEFVYVRAKRGKYLSLITLKTSSTSVYVKTERLANNCFNRFGSFTKCYASGGFVAPIHNGSLRKNLSKTKFKL